MKLITKMELLGLGLFLIFGLGTNLLSALKLNKGKLNKSLNSTKITSEQPEIHFFTKSNTTLQNILIDHQIENYNDFILYDLLLKNPYTKYSLLLLISSMFLLLSFFRKNYIINLIESKIKLSYELNFTYDNIVENIDYILSLPEVKEYLFLNEISYFKRKYGENFTLQNSDYILLKKEVLEILTYELNIDSMDKLTQITVKKPDQTINYTKNKIQEIVHEKIRLENEKKYNLIFYSVRGALIIILLFSIFAIFSSFKKNSIRTLNEEYFYTYFSFISLFVGVISFILIYGNKEDNQKNQKLSEKDFISNNCEDFMVVERLLIK
jgi:hypothetical protein